MGLKEGGKSAYTYEALGAGKAGRNMEPFLVRLRPLLDRNVVRNTHEGEEFVITSYSIHYTKLYEARNSCWK